MPDKFVNPGQNVSLAAEASGTGPFSYVWKRDGNIIPGQTGNTLVLASLRDADAGNYSVEVTGPCETKARTAALRVNLPPRVSIVNPTNGETFAFPGSFPVVASAADLDGVITRVEIFDGATNLLGFTTDGGSFFVMCTNLQPGGYTFFAKATDDMGAVGISTPVTVEVVDTLQPVILSEVRLNLQTGLFEQKVRIINTTASTIEGLRLYVENVQPTVRVWNASGTNNGTAYIATRTPIASGEHLDLVVEYYNSVPVAPQATFRVEVVPLVPGGGVTAVGQQIHITRALMRPDGFFLLEFPTEANRAYYVQYSSDLQNWLQAEPALTGTGTQYQWLDNGQPKTISAPSAASKRFYRVVVLP